MFKTSARLRARSIEFWKLLISGCFGFRYSTFGFSNGHPCRCLWRGFLQITRTTFLRFTILQLAQSLFTDGRTFIIREMENAEPRPRRHFWRNVIRPFDKS